MTTASAPVQALIDVLRVADPASVLIIGAGAVAEAAEAFLLERPGVAMRAAPDLSAVGDERFDCALIGGVVGVWPDSTARQLLGALRDRHSRSIAVLARGAAWPLTDYLALGFEHRGTVAGEDIYWYDRDRSNPEREWNNPDHWANPENFKRFRW